jgi:hypothetical protein
MVLATPTDFQWFNYPEGTRMAYENNFGEKDTAVFGPVRIEEGRDHDDKSCYTVYVQIITQDIIWLKNLKGRARPTKLLSIANRDFLSLEYSDGKDSPYGNTDFVDSSYCQNKKYNDVSIRCCGSGYCGVECEELSKTAFILKISYLLPDNTLETWQRK